MACMSCAERAKAIRLGTKAAIRGDLQEVAHQAKEVGVSVQRDVKSGIKAAAQAARSRMSSFRR